MISLGNCPEAALARFFTKRPLKKTSNRTVNTPKKLTDTSLKKYAKIRTLRSLNKGFQFNLLIHYDCSFKIELGETMDFSIRTKNNWSKIKTNALIIPFTSIKQLSQIVKSEVPEINATIDKLIKQKKISDKNGASTTLYFPDQNYQQVSFIAIPVTFCEKAMIQFAKTCFSIANNNLCQHCTLFSFVIEDAISAIRFVVETLIKESYCYNETKSKAKPTATLTKVSLVVEQNTQKVKQSLLTGQAIGKGANVAKHLGNLPANICTPSYLANYAKSMAKSNTSLKTQILTEPQLKKLKMDSLLSVTAGTEEPAKVIIMEYKNIKGTEKPTVLVGKGVTFDSGGISLKPGAKMDEMKFDMCGAASVFGTLHAAMEMNLATHIIGIVGAVENMPSGKATKPGDVVTSMSGQTIEVLNTDAEGRLVLCDLLTYAKKFKPKTVIDIATLTGACVVALGHHATGLYANNDTLSNDLKKAGEIAMDRAWPMPLWEEYDKQLESAVADIGNIGGPTAGSITAAAFLGRFTEDYHWAHLDIAGTAWQGKKASGRPVGLLTQFLISQAK